jgi:hypothetical protein
MLPAALDSLFRILHAASRFEVRMRQRATRPIWLFLLVQGALLFISLAFGSAFRFFSAPPFFEKISLVVLMGFYLGVLVYPFLMTWFHRRSFWEAIRHPFGLLIKNARGSATIDTRYLPKLMNKPLENVELLLMEIKSEKEFFERRISLVVGPIEKLGLVPGLLATAVSLQTFQQGQSEWITVLAYASPAVFIYGTAAHFLVMRLDRMVKLLELVVASKKEALTRPSSGQAEATFS